MLNSCDKVDEQIYFIQGIKKYKITCEASELFLRSPIFSIVKKGNEFEIEPEQIYSYTALENTGKPGPYCDTE